MKSKYFKIFELVPLHIYKKYGDKAFMFLDDRLLKSIDTLKEIFNKGTITINNYYWGGDRNWSGLRTPESPYYSPTSQHSFGRAVDCIFSKYDVEEVRKFIIDNPDKFPYIKGIELGVSWLHIDVRNSDEVILFSKG